MKDLGSCRQSSLMSRLDVGDPKRDLSARSRGSILGFIEREVHERAIGPTRRGVTATGPRIVALVVVDVKFEAECIAVELHSSIQIRDREHNRHQPIDVVAHPSRLPGPARRCKCESERRTAETRVIAEGARDRQIWAGWSTEERAENEQDTEQGKTEEVRYPKERKLLAPVLGIGLTHHEWHPARTPCPVPVE